MLIRIVNILMALALIIEPVTASIALGQQSGQAASQNSGQSVATEDQPSLLKMQDPLLNGIIVRKHPTKPGVIQVMKEATQPGEPPLIINLSFNDDGLPQIEVSGGAAVSVGPEQNSIQQKLFARSDLIERLIKDPSDENKTEVSKLIEPEMTSISDKVIASLPENGKLPIPKRAAIATGRILIKAFIAVSTLVLVLIPIIATNAHLGAPGLSFADDASMFIGSTGFEAIAGAFLYGGFKGLKVYNAWTGKMKPAPSFIGKPKEKTPGLIDKAKDRVCNFTMGLVSLVKKRGAP